MSHYLVYVPREHCEAAQQLDATRSPLEHVGLADHVAGAFSLAVADGPDNKGGTLFAWQPNNGAVRLHYRADEQDWIPAVPRYDQPAERYWLGFWRDSPVTPRDILRPRTTPGTELAIGEHSWRIPSAEMLPAVAAFMPDGEWATEVEPAYREYWSAVESLRLTLLAGREEMELAEMFEFCLQALSVNYRLAREVLGHLQVLSTESAPRILRTAIGLTAVPGVGEG